MSLKGSFFGLTLWGKVDLGEIEILWIWTLFSVRNAATLSTKRRPFPAKAPRLGNSRYQASYPAPNQFHPKTAAQTGDTQGSSRRRLHLFDSLQLLGWCGGLFRQG